MTFYQKVQVVQYFVIIVTGITGIILLRKKSGPERRYILPFILIDIPVMTGILYQYIKGIDLKTFFLFSTFYSWCEIFLIPFYFSEIIGKKKNFIVPIFLCVSTPLISYKFLGNIHEIPLLASNFYLSYYVFLYFDWIFKSSTQYDLIKSSHFWISIGILLSYTTTIPYFITDLVLYSWANGRLYDFLDLTLFLIFLILNIVMYFLFMRSFFLAKSS